MAQAGPQPQLAAPGKVAEVPKQTPAEVQSAGLATIGKLHSFGVDLSGIEEITKRYRHQAALPGQPPSVLDWQARSVAEEKLDGLTERIAKHQASAIKQASEIACKLTKQTRLGGELVGLEAEAGLNKQATLLSTRKPHILSRSFSRLRGGSYERCG